MTAPENEEDDRALLARAEAAIKVRDEFLSLASHELRTPLTPLRLALDSLRRRLTRPGLDAVRAIREVEQSLQQVQRITTLVDCMLDLTRVTTGRLSLERAKSDLLPIVRAAVDGFQEQAKRAECTLELMTRAEKIEGLWDTFRLEQVFVNLVSNALKYAPGGPIRVEASIEDGFARVAVVDSGKGIPQEHAELIFERFARAVTGVKMEGLGLGLFLARNIVQAHGGTIRMESSPGQGAAFVVMLPMS